MSRKWERMVEKNRKQVNRRRQKQGSLPIVESPKDQMELFRGRSWFLPALLVACSFFFAVVSGLAEAGTLYYFTVAGYLLLGIFYFMRRPYVKVGKDKLATRKLGVERTYPADTIETISLQSGSVAIQFKGKRTRWVLSKFQSLYDIPAMSASLKTFADRNGIPYTDETA